MKYIIPLLLACACGGPTTTEPTPDSGDLPDVAPEAAPALNICNLNGIVLACTGPGFNVFTDAGTYTCFDHTCTTGEQCSTIGTAQHGFCE